MLKTKKQTSQKKAYQAATPQQLAEIDRYKQLCRVHSSAINNPFSYLITIVTTTILFSVLVNRESAPFHESYLNLLDKFFSTFRPHELTVAFIDTSQKEITLGLETIDKNCLQYYKYLKEQLETIASELSINQVDTHDILNGGVFGNGDLPAPDAERMLTTLYEQSGVESIRDHCLTFCESFMENSRLPDYAFHTLLSGHTRVQALRLYELFQATEKLVDLAQNTSLFYFKNLLKKAELHDRLLTLERQSSVINLAKMVVIGLSKHLILSPTLNYFFPFSLTEQSRVSQSYQKPELLTDTDAAKQIEKLQTHEQSLRNKAVRYSQLTNKLFLVLAGGALLFLFTCGLSGIPGELGFFLMSVLASMSYQLMSLGKQRVHQYYSNKQIQYTEELLKKNLGKDCNITQQQTSNVVQFQLGVTKPQYFIILKRCFEYHSIRIISNNKREMIIDCNSRLNKKTLEDVAKQFHSACDRLSALKNITKILKNIQSHCSQNEKITTELYFDEKGYPSETWYLSTNNKNMIQVIEAQLKSDTYSIQQNKDGLTIITLNDNITPTQCNAVIESIKHIKPDENRLAVPQKFPRTFDQTSSSLSSTKLKRRGQTTSPQEPSQKNITSTEDNTRSPFPHSEAKKVQATFLPSDANLWALFAAKEEDFPTKECYEKFQELLLVPRIVSPIDQQGLVFDEEQSKPGQRRWKAKVLGTYGMFRLKSSRVDTITTEDGLEHQVHIFDQLVLAHT